MNWLLPSLLLAAATTGAQSQQPMTLTQTVPTFDSQAKSRLAALARPEHELYPPWGFNFLSFPKGIRVFTIPVPHRESALSPQETTMLLHAKTSSTNTFALVLTQCCFYAVAATCLAQAPPTFKQLLESHHVAITETSLLRALDSPDKEIRSLAAAELSELKFTADLPEIIRAARTETDPLTQVNIAAAATWLDSDEGLQILTSICRDQTLPGHVRISAARNAFDKQDRTCFSSVIDQMRPGAEPGERLEAISAASQIKSKTPQEAQLVLDALLLAIVDKDPGVKLEASGDLRWLNDPRCLQPLREAIEEEQDKTIKQQMRSDLDYLERSHSHQR